LIPNQPSDANPPTRDERRVSAEELREQAAACRRLAGNARTRAGGKALDNLGDHFDESARKMDPSSQRR
jgi:hypothetical protein